MCRRRVSVSVVAKMLVGLAFCASATHVHATSLKDQVGEFAIGQSGISVKDLLTAVGLDLNNSSELINLIQPALASNISIAGLAFAITSIDQIPGASADKDPDGYQFNGKITIGSLEFGIALRIVEKNNNRSYAIALRPTAKKTDGGFSLGNLLKPVKAFLPSFLQTITDKVDEYIKIVDPVVVISTIPGIMKTPILGLSGLGPGLSVAVSIADYNPAEKCIMCKAKKDSGLEKLGLVLTFAKKPTALKDIHFMPLIKPAAGKGICLFKVFTAVIQEIFDNIGAGSENLKSILNLLSFCLHTDFGILFDDNFNMTFYVVGTPKIGDKQLGDYGMIKGSMSDGFKFAGGLALAKDLKMGTKSLHEKGLAAKFAGHALDILNSQFTFSNPFISVTNEKNGATIFDIDPVCQKIIDPNPAKKEEQEKMLLECRDAKRNELLESLKPRKVAPPPPEPSLDDFDFDDDDTTPTTASSAQTTPSQTTSPDTGSSDINDDEIIVDDDTEQVPATEKAIADQNDAAQDEDDQTQAEQEKTEAEEKKKTANKELKKLDIPFDFSKIRHIDPGVIFDMDVDTVKNTKDAVLDLLLAPLHMDKAKMRMVIPIKKCFKASDIKFNLTKRLAPGEKDEPVNLVKALGFKGILDALPSMPLVDDLNNIQLNITTAELDATTKGVVIVVKGSITGSKFLGTINFELYRQEEKTVIALSIPKSPDFSKLLGDLLGAGFEPFIKPLTNSFELSNTLITIADFTPDKTKKDFDPQAQAAQMVLFGQLHTIRNGLTIRSAATMTTSTPKKYFEKALDALGLTQVYIDIRSFKTKGSDTKTLTAELFPFNKQPESLIQTQKEAASDTCDKKAAAKPAPLLPDDPEPAPVQLCPIKLVSELLSPLGVDQILKSIDDKLCMGVRLFFTNDGDKNTLTINGYSDEQQARFMFRSICSVKDGGCKKTFGLTIKSLTIPGLGIVIDKPDITYSEEGNVPLFGFDQQTLLPDPQSQNIIIAPKGLAVQVPNFDPLTIIEKPFKDLGAEEFIKKNKGKLTTDAHIVFDTPDYTGGKATVIYGDIPDQNAEFMAKIKDGKITAGFELDSFKIPGTSLVLKKPTLFYAQSDGQNIFDFDEKTNALTKGLETAISVPAGLLMRADNFCPLELISSIGIDLGTIAKELCDNVLVEFTHDAQGKPLMILDGHSTKQNADFLIKLGDNKKTVVLKIDSFTIPGTDLILKKPIITYTDADKASYGLGKQGELLTDGPIAINKGFAITVDKFCPLQLITSTGIDLGDLAQKTCVRATITQISAQGATKTIIDGRSEDGITEIEFKITCKPGSPCTKTMGIKTGNFTIPGIDIPIKQPIITYTDAARDTIFDTKPTGQLTIAKGFAINVPIPEELLIAELKDYITGIQIDLATKSIKVLYNEKTPLCLKNFIPDFPDFLGNFCLTPRKISYSQEKGFAITGSLTVFGEQAEAIIEIGKKTLIAIVPKNFSLANVPVLGTVAKLIDISDATFAYASTATEFTINSRKIAAPDGFNLIGKVTFKDPLDKVLGFITESMQTGIPLNKIGKINLSTKVEKDLGIMNLHSASIVLDPQHPEEFSIALDTTIKGGDGLNLTFKGTGSAKGDLSLKAQLNCAGQDCPKIDFKKVINLPVIISPIAPGSTDCPRSKTDKTCPKIDGKDDALCTQCIKNGTPLSFTIGITGGAPTELGISGLFDINKQRFYVNANINIKDPTRIGFIFQSNELCLEQIMTLLFTFIMQNANIDVSMPKILCLKDVSVQLATPPLPVTINNITINPGIKAQGKLDLLGLSGSLDLQATANPLNKDFGIKADGVVDPLTVTIPGINLDLLKIGARTQEKDKKGATIHAELSRSEQDIAIQGKLDLLDGLLSGDINLKLDFGQANFVGDVKAKMVDTDCDAHLVLDAADPKRTRVKITAQNITAANMGKLITHITSKLVGAKIPFPAIPGPKLDNLVLDIGLDELTNQFGVRLSATASLAGEEIIFNGIIGQFDDDGTQYIGSKIEGTISPINISEGDTTILGLTSTVDPKKGPFVKVILAVNQSAIQAAHDSIPTNAITAKIMLNGKANIMDILKEQATVVISPTTSEIIVHIQEGKATIKFAATMTKNWDFITNFNVANLITPLKNAAVELDVTGDPLSLIKESITQSGETAKAGAKAAHDLITNKFDGIKDKCNNLKTKLLKSQCNNTVNVAQTQLNTAQKMYNTVTDLIDTAINALTISVIKIKGTLQGFKSSFSADIDYALSGSAAHISVTNVSPSNPVSMVLKLAPELAKAIFTNAQGQINLLGDILKNIGSTVADIASNIGELAVNIVEDVFTGTLDLVEGLLTNPLETFENLASDALTITNTIGNTVIGGITSVIGDEATAAISQAGQEAINAIGDFGEDAINAIDQQAQQLGKDIEQALNVLDTSIKDALNQINKTFEEIGKQLSQITQEVEKAINQALGAITDAANKAAQAVADAAKAVADEVVKAAKAVCGFLGIC